MTSTSAMKAAAIDRFGPPSVLSLHTLPKPEPGPSEVIIAVEAAGVGIWDAKIRDGSWAEGKPRFPRVLGTDGAGRVVAVGSRVRRFRVGERVWAYEFNNRKGGFYAEYVAVDARHVARAPRRLDLLQAGAAAVTGLTALQGIDDALEVRRGETVFVFGATGAVGTLAVQFARWRGARVLGTATGRAAARLLEELGVDGVVDGHRPDAARRLEALAPDGIDAALVLAGGRTLAASLKRVRPGGRIAYPNGVEPEPRPRRGITVEGYDASVGPRELARLDRAVAGARLRVVIAAAYPLAQAAKAHQRLERGHVVGRIVLRAAPARR
jgi:NADPH:quinone reductase-like Zn-dependent oxidoreductase